jgi:hypothetical protein
MASPVMPGIRFREPRGLRAVSHLRCEGDVRGVLSASGRSEAAELP